ncbi:MAG: hypothetical protein ACFFE4_23245 [Candidatus Thorarchaeota archaeon]
MNKKSVILLIVAIVYVILVGILVPTLIEYFNLFPTMYSYFFQLSRVGVFFFTYLMSTFFFFPFIYSTLVKEKLSFNIDTSKKKQKNPRYYAKILFLIGLPILIWLIYWNIGYYSITDVSGGLGEFVVNGFLVCIFVLLYFCIFPAIILALKKNRY